MLIRPLPAPPNVVYILVVSGPIYMKFGMDPLLIKCIYQMCSNVVYPNELLEKDMKSFPKTNKFVKKKVEMD